MSLLYIFLAFIAGLALGVLVTRRFMVAEVKRAYEVARKEFEQKKSDLSDKIGDQLSDMRQGLVRTLEAYVGAVSVVRENLPISSEKLSELIAPAKLRLGKSEGSTHSAEEQVVSVEITSESTGEVAPDKSSVSDQSGLESITEDTQPKN
jgi:hypothetical protein